MKRGYSFAMSLARPLFLSLLAATLVGCTKSPPRDEQPAPAVSPSAPTPLVLAPPPATTSAPGTDDGPPNESTFGRMAREDAMSIDVLFAKSKSLPASLYRRIDKKVDVAGIASVSEVERNLFLAYKLDAEVKFGGGFGAYFDGDAGDRTTATLAALKAMNADPFIKIFWNAIAVFPGSKPAEDRGARQKQLKAISKPGRDTLDALSKEWLKLPDISPSYIEKYARTNKGAF
jgi:hypothetical protein